jgi:hypothetical protein
MVKDLIDRYLKKKYNISEIEEPPVIICTCGQQEGAYIIYDYYTIRNDTDDGYLLVLCSTCRICGFYAEHIVTDEEIPFYLKSPPPNAGFNFIEEKKEEIKQGDLYA